jgi:hypothetical protein
VTAEGAGITGPAMLDVMTAAGKLTARGCDAVTPAYFYKVNIQTTENFIY